MWTYRRAKPHIERIRPAFLYFTVTYIPYAPSNVMNVHGTCRVTDTMPERVVVVGAKQRLGFILT